MAEEPQADHQDQADQFARQAVEQSANIFVEFWDFLVHNKKWWLIPIIVMLLLLGVFVFIVGTPASPFLYTFF